MGAISRIVIIFACLSLLCFSLLLSFPITVSSAHSTEPPSCASSAPTNVTETPVPPPATSGLVLINEVLTNPAHAWDCSAPTLKKPWIELYNPQNQAFDLYAAHTELDLTPGSYTYSLPLGSVIAAHGFLVFFPESRSYVNATLSLLLNGIVVDQIAAPPLAADQSYARTQDGSTDWQTSSVPTIASSNTIVIPPTPPPPTPTQSHRITPTPTKPHPKTTGSSPGKQATRTEPPALGTQPSWDQLQIPGTTTLTSDNPAAQPATTPVSNVPQSSGDETKKKLLISCIAILLIIALLWCMKLFLTN